MLKTSCMLRQVLLVLAVNHLTLIINLSPTAQHKILSELFICAFMVCIAVEIL